MPEATSCCAAPERSVAYFAPVPAPYAPLFHHPWSIHSMAMGEMTTPRSPLQSDSEGSTSSLELGSGVASLALNSTPPAAAQEAVKCRWQHCGLWFKHLDQLAMHVTMVHAAAGQGGLFYCGWDGCSRGHRGFNARYKMLVHVRTHTNEKPHRCTQCDKSFSRAENLKIHARSHTGERPYTCPVPGCNKAYSNSSDRFKHTRTHAVDKPYVCKVEGCPKRYTDPSSLRKHVKTYRHFPGAVSSPLGSPHASPHGSPLRSPSSDEETRSAFRTVVSTSSESLSPASLERPPLPGGYRGIPIKKAISARVRGELRRDPDSVSDYEHATDGSLSPPLATTLTAAGSVALHHQRTWAGGSVWVSAAALGGSLSGTASPDTLSPSSSPSGADWFPPAAMPVPVVPWGLSLWGFPSREDVIAHPRAMPAMPHPQDQAVPLDLTVTRH